MAGDDADLVACAEAVARALFGKPNVSLSKKNDLRFGANGSMSLNLEKGTFYSFELEAGGGVLWAIEHHKGLAGIDAIAWMRDELGLDVGRDRPAYKSNGANGAAAPNGKDHGARKEIEATYDYTDEEGRLLFQTVRQVFKNADGTPVMTGAGKPKKTFLQRRKTDDGQWVWNVQETRIVPYRLPDLVRAVSGGQQVFVVEGERKADLLRRLGVQATCNPMGAGKWLAEFAPLFAGAEVVILPDNDEAGQKHAATVAASLFGTAAAVRIVALPGLPDKGDVIEWHSAGGDVHDLLALVEESPVWAPPAPKLRYGAVWFKDIDHALAEPEWLVEDMLTRGDISLAYGPSQSGKSFFATHVAMAIVRGSPIFGKHVRKGGVVYIAAEGKKGFKKRLRAYRQEFGIEPEEAIYLLLIPSAVDLFTKDGDTTGILEDLGLVQSMLRKAGQTLELVVIDTHAAVSPGANENASEDMSRSLKAYQRIQESTGAHVMIVHHKNAAGDKPRGHTSLYAAADNAIEVMCDEAKNRTAKIAKMKDAEDGARFDFRLKAVEVGTSETGKTITSCVVVQVDQGSHQDRGPRLSDQQMIALQALRSALGEHGEPAPAPLRLPYGIMVVRAEHWKREFLARGFIGEEPNEETFRKAFRRVGEGLKSRGVIGTNQPYVWIAREPSR